jgi:hypothetical protein
VFDINVVQNLCRAIAEEDDSRRTADLLKALREVIKDQQEEFRFRLLYVARQCAANLAEESEVDVHRETDYASSKESRHTVLRSQYPSPHRKSLFGSVCLTLLREEFKPEEL